MDIMIRLYYKGLRLPAGGHVRSPEHVDCLVRWVAYSLNSTAHVFIFNLVNFRHIKK